MLNEEGFNPSVTYENAGPLYFALLYDKIDIFKVLLNDKRFFDFQVYERLNLFEYCIVHDKYDIADLLLEYTPDVNILGKYTNSYIPSFSVDCEFEESEYINKLIPYFVENTTNEKIQKLKKEIFNENKTLFICLAAKYLDENKFEQFLDLPEIDVNDINEHTRSILNFYFFK